MSLQKGLSDGQHSARDQEIHQWTRKEIEESFGFGFCSRQRCKVACTMAPVQRDKGEGTRMEDALHVCSTFRPNRIV